MATVGDLAAAVGKGLFAGVAGTAAITASQMIVMKIRHGGSSDVPAQAASRPASPTSGSRLAALVWLRRGHTPPTQEELP